MDDLTKQKITHTVRGVLKSKEEGKYLVRPEHHKKQFTVVNGIRLFFFFPSTHSHCSASNMAAWSVALYASKFDA